MTQSATTTTKKRAKKTAKRAPKKADPPKSAGELRGALGKLKALAARKPSEGDRSPLASQISDPAIAGAKRVRNVVELGTDPRISERAELCAAYKAEVDKAVASFATLQTEMRDYGKEKRDAYNDAFKTDVTTVCVPFLVEVPGGQPETRFVQVVCTSRYSVRQDAILNSKEEMGEHYDQLFEETRSQVLKPNAEELLREVLLEAGVDEANLDETMAVLFEENVSVKARPEYEKRSKSVPEDVAVVLDQAVTRQQPGLNFS